MANYTVQSPIELKGLSKFFTLVFHRSLERTLWTFCELGIADLMVDYGRPITALELSQLNGNNWNANFLYRLLRFVADADIVKAVNTSDETANQSDHLEETIRFQLTDDGLLLTSNHFSKARDMIRIEFNPNGEKTYAYAPSLIKSGMKNGASFEQAFGCDMFEYMKKDDNKEHATLFNNSMVTYSIHTISSMAELVDFTRFKKIVDIAGGLGTLLSFVLEKNLNLHGILFDLPHVVENAKTIHPNEFQRKQIESNRYEFVAGDMFKPETIPQADVYMLKFILHDWNDEKALEILRSIRNANQGEKEKTLTVVIIETIILSNDKDNWETHAMDVEMMINFGAKERTLSEYVHLLKQSGYEMKKVYKTQSFMSVIEATTTI